MLIEATPAGKQYTTREESDVAELSLGATGLRIVVSTAVNGGPKRVEIEYHFEAPHGFRYVDEGNLIRYWQSGQFARGYHLFEILQGGWLAQEVETAGMLSIASTFEDMREWFVCTTNGCVNVLSIDPPLMREFA